MRNTSSSTTTRVPILATLSSMEAAKATITDSRIERRANKDVRGLRRLGRNLSRRKHLRVSTACRDSTVID